MRIVDRDIELRTARRSEPTAREVVVVVVVIILISGVNLAATRESLDPSLPFPKIGGAPPSPPPPH